MMGLTGSDDWNGHSLFLFWRRNLRCWWAVHEHKDWMLGWADTTDKRLLKKKRERKVNTETN